MKSATSPRRKVLGVCVFVVCILTGMSAATQWFASVYHYSNSLGLALFNFDSTRIYVPWKIFAWAKEFEGIAKEAISQSISFIVLGGVVGFGLLFLINTVNKLGSSGSGSVYGDSCFASRKDIAERGLLSQKGVFIGALETGEYLRHDGPEHYAVIAPTRSGKGAGIVVPTLLSWKESAIIYDLKEENYRVTAAERSKFSDIIYFNPNDINSAHFNPLLEVRPGINEVRDVQNIANMIIEPEGPGVGDHWIRTGNSLLVATILHVLYTAPNGEKNLAGVTSFLSRATQSLTETLNEMIETKHIRDENGVPLHPHPHIQESARDVLNKSPDDKSSVHSTVMGYLSLYRDPLLAHNTRDSDFAITDLVGGSRPKSLYLVIPPADIMRLRPIIRLIINQICRRLTEELPGDEQMERRHRLLLMMDEFPALGRLEFFESALGFLAGYGLKVMLICQSMNQLKSTYGDRNSLLDNTHVKIFYTPETIETGEYISKSLGQTTVEYQTEGESGKKGSLFYTGKSAASHIAGRPLLTPREVLDLPKTESLIFMGGARPIRCKKITYYDDGSFMRLLSKAPKPSREGVEALETRIKSKQNAWFTKFGDTASGYSTSEVDHEEDFVALEVSPTDEHEIGLDLSFGGQALNNSDEVV